MNASGRVTFLSAQAAALLAPLLLFAAACGGSDGGPSLTDRFLVVRIDGIYELSLATGEETSFIADPLDSYVSDPAVSPDGAQVAYVRIFPDVDPGDTGFSADLYVANRDGAGGREIYHHEHPGEQVRWPVWLPSGDALLISAERFEGAQFITEVRRVDVTTGESELLASEATQPDLSRDGTQITYVGVASDGSYSLWIADADGANGRALALAPPNAGSFQSPRFSPDGTRIVVAISSTFSAGAQRAMDASYVSRNGGPVPGPRTDEAYNGFPMNLWIVDVATGELQLLAELALDQPNLRWSPDGVRIFVHTDAGLFSIDAATGVATRLANGYLHGTFDWAGAE